MTAWVPWDNSPPVVLPFPVVPVRYWHVREVLGRPGVFRGDLQGVDWEDFHGPTATEEGALHLVLSALTFRANSKYRRGLPVIVEGGR